MSDLTTTNRLWHETNDVDEDDRVVYNLMEDIRCLKEDIAAAKNRIIELEEAINDAYVRVLLAQVAHPDGKTLSGAAHALAPYATDHPEGDNHE